MKDLIHEDHHPHLKKRFMLETLGFAVLVLISYLQWDVLKQAFSTISEVNASWFILLLSLYWLIQPLTAISYKLISPKPKKMRLGTMIIAHLAGAGPGRIIPGGVGNISIMSLHLKKAGLSIEQAIGIVVTNNLFGLFANLTLVGAALIIRPETISILTDNISSQQLIYAGAFIVLGLVLYIWLMHFRSARKEVNKTAKQWRKIAKSFVRQPKKALAVFSIGITIALTHTFMLDFSAYALGFDLSIFDALIAMSFGVAIGGVIPTPGGVGGVEAGIITVLIVLGFAPAEATSVALLFRIATYWQPLIPGTLAYLYLRERNLL